MKYLSTRSNRQMIRKGACKTKAIQRDISIITYVPEHSSIFRQSQSFPGIIRRIQELFRHIQAYLELCYIQNQEHIQNFGIFRTRGIFKILVYSKRWYIQNPRHIQTLPNNYDIAFCENTKRLYLISEYQLFTFSTLWNKYDFC